MVSPGIFFLSKYKVAHLILHRVVKFQNCDIFRFLASVTLIIDLRFPKIVGMPLF
jgi:hypothetical protein